MGYCFMTIGKIHSKAQMTTKYKHNYREYSVLNADPSLSKNNEEIVPLNGKNYIEAFDERIKKLEFYQNGGKIRSNNVLAYEIVCTFSKEDAEKVDIQKWKQDNYQWLKDTFDKNPEKNGTNILGMISHEDEGNIHIHCFVTPVDERGHLNAYYFTGGPAKMRKLQDSYAKYMEGHGLKRGIKGSRATHQDLKHFYTALNKQFERGIPKREEHEDLDIYLERVNNEFIKQNLKIFGLEKKIERLEVEKSSLENQYNIMLYEEKSKLRKKERKLEKKFGDTEKAIEKIELASKVEKYIDECQDKEFVRKIMEKGKNNKGEGER